MTVLLVAFSGIGQAVVTKVGVRKVFPVGFALATVAFVLFAQLPAHGHYWKDLFPGFIVVGIALALVFVSMSIGALQGVGESDAGVASGLINTTQQVGGAVGVAAALTVATTVTNHYVKSHAGLNAFSPAALTHGFDIAFWVLAVAAAVGGVISAVAVESQPAVQQPDPQIPRTAALEPDAA
jgi:MFS family permease